MQQDRWNGTSLKLLINRGKDQKSSECLLTTLSFSILQKHSSILRPAPNVISRSTNFPLPDHFQLEHLNSADLVRLSIHSFDRSHKIFVFFFLIQYSISMRTWWFLKRKKNRLAPVVKKRRFGRNGRRMFAGKSQQAYPVYSGLMTRLRTFVRVTCSFRGGERERERTIGPAH